MYVYMSDAWGGRINQSKRIVQGEHCVQLRGKFRHEFALERVLLFVMTPGHKIEKRMLCTPPRGLKTGKGAWQIFTAACELFQLLRAEGHQGMCVSLYLQDGQLYEPLRRHVQARHVMYYEPKNSPDLENREKMLLTDLPITMCRSPRAIRFLCQLVPIALRCADRHSVSLSAWHAVCRPLLRLAGVYHRKAPHTTALLRLRPARQPGGGDALF